MRAKVKEGKQIINWDLLYEKQMIDRAGHKQKKAGKNSTMKQNSIKVPAKKLLCTSDNQH